MTTLSDRGLKHTCASCETRFFDMGRQPAICPSCKKKVVPPKPAAPGRRSAKISAADSKPSPAGFLATPTSAKPKKLRFR